jgi:hypothetical protein
MAARLKSQMYFFLCNKGAPEANITTVSANSEELQMFDCILQSRFFVHKMTQLGDSIVSQIIWLSWAYAARGCKTDLPLLGDRSYKMCTRQALLPFLDLIYRVDFSEYLGCLHFMDLKFLEIVYVLLCDISFLLLFFYLTMHFAITTNRHSDFPIDICSSALRGQ